MFFFIVFSPSIFSFFPKKIGYFPYFLHKILHISSKKLRIEGHNKRSSNNKAENYRKNLTSGIGTGPCARIGYIDNPSLIYIGKTVKI